MADRGVFRRRRVPEFVRRRLGWRSAPTAGTVSTRCVLGTPNQSSKAPGSTYYFRLATAISKSAFGGEAAAEFPFRTRWRLTFLEIDVRTNDVSGASTYRARKNTAYATSSVTIGAGLTGLFTDDTHTDTYEVGDRGALELMIASGGTELEHGQSAFLRTVDGQRTVHVYHTEGLEGSWASDTRYCTLGQGAPAGTGGGLLGKDVYFETAGTFRHLRVVWGDARVSSSSEVGVIVDGASTLSVTIGAGLTGTFTAEGPLAVPAGGRAKVYATFGAGTDFGGGTSEVELESPGRGWVWPSAIGSATEYISATPVFWPVASVSGSQWAGEAGIPIPARFAGSATRFGVYVESNTASGPLNGSFRRNYRDSILELTVGAGLTGYFETSGKTVNLRPTDMLCYRSVGPGGGGSIIVPTWYVNAVNTGVSVAETQLPPRPLRAALRHWLRR